MTKGVPFGTPVDDMKLLPRSPDDLTAPPRAIILFLEDRLSSQSLGQPSIRPSRKSSASSCHVVKLL